VDISTIISGKSMTGAAHHALDVELYFEKY
jgi:hypothetical protein